VVGVKVTRKEEGHLCRNQEGDIQISAIEDILRTIDEDIPQRDGKEEWRKRWV
jgi:hypothetical protein